MNIKACFDTLCVSRDASLEEAKQAYKQLVKRWHPDQYGNDPEKQHIAHQKLTEINVAYREIVALLKNTTSSEGPGSGAEKATGRRSETFRKSTKKVSFFQRMASIFKTHVSITDAGHGQPSEDGHRAVRKGCSVSPGSVFRQELKRAIRRHPGRFPMGASSEGQVKQHRRRQVGRTSRGDTMYRMPPTPRRSRGNRVERIEKIKPVRRVGKIGE